MSRQRSASSAAAPGVDPRVEAYLVANGARRLESYKAFLRIPSISGLPEFAPDCRVAAEFVARELRAMGVEHVTVEETRGHPIVYGHWLHADNAPTVIVYGHYDVQSADPLELWDSPPFEPMVKDGKIFARGAADDKGQVHLHLRAAEALLAACGALPVNLKFIFEGEEESDSVHFDDWLTRNKTRLAADLAVVSDSRFFHGNRPAITIGLRGILYTQIDVYGSPLDLHSGLYGGAVDNPANILCEIIARLKDTNGVVTVPGFYDDVTELTKGDRDAISVLPFDEETYRLDIGVRALHGEPGYPILERLGARPTLDVNGLWSGSVGPGTKTIIPAHAHAKVSCRLVPNQEPNQIFRLLSSHVRTLAPQTVDVELRALGQGRPTVTGIDHPAIQSAARAIEATFGVVPILNREGVSIPVCASFEAILGLPVLLLGFGPPDDRSHAPNEWMHLGNYETGIRAVIRLWDELADSREDFAGR